MATTIPDRAHIKELLGSRFGSISFVHSHEVDVTDIVGGTATNLRFTTSEGVQIPAVLLKPGAAGPTPAILYCHAHGNRYDIGTEELLEGRPALTGAYGPDLLASGYAVLCLEMPCFGSRATTSEDAAAKAALWHGQTLMGQMLGELAAGVTWLASLPSVDSARIGTMGISMGGTHAWWLGALDERIRSVVHMCCFADLACLTDSGAHDGHGNYMTVPRLLAHCSTGRLAGLLAPRPQLCCAGLKDWSTPPDAFEKGKADLVAAYGEQDAADALVFHVEPDLGHSESPAMREKVLSFLANTL